MPGIIMHADHDQEWCPVEPDSLAALGEALDAWWANEQAWQATEAGLRGRRVGVLLSELLTRSTEAIACPS